VLWLVSRRRNLVADLVAESFAVFVCATVNFAGSRVQHHPFAYLGLVENFLVEEISCSTCQRDAIVPKGVTVDGDTPCYERLDFAGRHAAAKDKCFIVSAEIEKRSV
jgi:hypothetical protein